MRNVRCFEDVTIDLGPGITVILGGNGAGKTTVVEAIASLTYGGEDGLPEFPLRQGSTSGEITLNGSGPDSSARWTKDASGSSRTSLPEDLYLFAYGRYRRVSSPGGGDPLANPDSDLDLLASTAGDKRTTTLYQPDNTLLQNLGRYLRALHYGGRSDLRLRTIWEQLEEALRQLEQGIEGIRIDDDGLNLEPKILRGGLALDLRELSDGYQALLVVIFDLFLRYAYLFQDLDDPLTGRAVVLIDEVDLHLHPRWQRLVIHQLSTLFPNTQFVLTTHSPEVVQGAIDSGSHVVSLLESKTGKVTAYHLDGDPRKGLEGADVDNLLLHEALFGVESRFSPEFSQIEREVDRLQILIDQDHAEDEERRAGFRTWPQALGALQRRSKDREDFPAAWGQAKEALAAMTKRKCAYCEAPLAGERLGQVDHFKPKALFPSLAYDWENYFLACGRCNGTKQKQWPTEGSYLRPDDGDPPAELIFSEDGRVRPARLGGDAERTVEDFDLNEEWLADWRAKNIAKALDDIRWIIRGLPESEALEQARYYCEHLKEMTDLEFYVAVIQCCERAIEEGRWKVSPPPAPP